MNTQAAISASTAFVLGFSASFMVAALGSGPIEAKQWVMIALAGLATAAKDLRSLYKMPPVTIDPVTPTPTNKAP
jgi:hypothetical protein